MYFLFLLLLRRLVPFSSERIHAPITARSIMRVQVVQIPSQTPKQILAWLEQHIHLVSEALVQEIHILLHIPWAVSSGDDGALSLQQERKCLFPLVHRPRVSETWMEYDEAVKVWIVRLEMSSLMEIVVVFDISADLHGVGYTIFDDGAEGVQRCLFRQRQLLLAVCHAFGTDEVEGELHSVEEIGELHPCFAGQGGLGAGSEDE